MARIKIGVKGLAKFMTGSPSAQRKLLRDYKYPDEEGTAQAAYYREARDLIAEHHRRGHDPEWLREKAVLLRATAGALGGRVRSRLMHNARALDAYATNFPARKFIVLQERKFFVYFGDVGISIVPDLHVRENAHERFIKLEFAADPPDTQIVRIVSQTMFEAAVAASLPVSGSDVLYLDVARGQTHKGARAGSRMRTEIEAACANISAMWDSIKP